MTLHCTITFQIALLETGYSADWMKSNPLSEPGEKADEDFQSNLDAPPKLWKVVADKFVTKKRSAGEQMNDGGSAKPHPCVKSTTKIVIGNRAFTKATCRSYSMTGCNGSPPFLHKCKRVYIAFCHSTLTTDCECAS